MLKHVKFIMYKLYLILSFFEKTLDLCSPHCDVLDSAARSDSYPCSILCVSFPPSFPFSSLLFFFPSSPLTSFLLYILAFFLLYILALFLKSVTSFSKSNLSGRFLSYKHVQHCHDKLVEMLRLPGRLVLSPLQRGRCSAKLASDPQGRLASPQGSRGDPIASVSWVQTMHILNRKRGSAFLRITGLWEEGRSFISRQEKNGPSLGALTYFLH